MRRSATASRETATSFLTVSPPSASRPLAERACQPYERGPVASAVSTPWGRWEWTKSPRSARRVIRSCSRKSGPRTSHFLSFSLILILGYVLWVIGGSYTHPRIFDRVPPGTQPAGGDMFSEDDRHRGCGGAGGFGGGRRGGRVGFGRGGAGAVFPRSQPSRFWRDPRPLIGSPRQPPAADQLSLGIWPRVAREVTSVLGGAASRVLI